MRLTPLAFARYIQARWGTPYGVGDGMGALLVELVTATEVYKKLVGIQLLIEGLAMGAFAHYHVNAHDPALHRLVQLVLTDEAHHHQFGKIWAERTVPKMTAEEQARVEDWAAQCFQTLLYSLTNIRQKSDIYARFGLDWEWVRGAYREVFTEEDRRGQFGDATNMFRVLVKTLLNAGIITDRTRPIFAAWVDMKELREEGDGFIGYEIAEEEVALLRGINKERKVIGQKIPPDGRRASVFG